jgi:hyaluronoglucosaminidase
MPEGYWRAFAQQLDPHIDMFWTGEKVCSVDYSAEHLAQVTELIGRKPFLWDNYPVNDGAVKSNLLQLRAFGKGHSQLINKVAGHAVNPMNQPWLSQIPLASLPLAYGDDRYQPELALAHILHKLCGKNLGSQLLQDIPTLQDRGLALIADEEKQHLRERYSQFINNPYAQEIVDWLDGQYRFDPACLTG